MSISKILKSSVSLNSVLFKKNEEMELMWEAYDIGFFNQDQEDALDCFREYFMYSELTVNLHGFFFACGGMGKIRETAEGAYLVTVIGTDDNKEFRFEDFYQACFFLEQFDQVEAHF